MIRITLVPSIKILLSIESLDGKNRLSEGQPSFYQIFRMLTSNQINSCEFTFHNVVHSINGKKNDFLKNMHFWVKNHFSGILKFLRIFWSDLVGAIGFLEAVGMD